MAWPAVLVAGLGLGVALSPSGVVLTLYLVSTAALVAYGLHAHLLLAWRRRSAPAYLARLAAARAAAPDPSPPRVLVQIPVYNEPAVVERVLGAVAALEHPHHALEIQVLDDSDDGSSALVDAAAARLRAQGAPIAVLRRNHREGHKAGAMAAGLERSDAEFVAVFDADFVPPTDFLRRALPLFRVGERVGCVQGRWGHLNRRENALTRAQAAAVDAHFLVEQLARAGTGKFLNFNGTAGVWRTRAIREAGGWTGDTLTEDLDLSYRAQLAGWDIVFDPDLVVPAELPPTLTAYVGQQRRWASGSTQNAVKHLGAVWRSGRALSTRVEATFHLCGYGVCLAMTVLCVTLPFAVRHLPMLDRLPGLWPVWGTIWLAALGPVAVAAAGLRASREGGVADLVGCVLLGLGACARNGWAVLRGAFVPLRTFVRTPKQGTATLLPPSHPPRVETAMAVACLVAAATFPGPRQLAALAYAATCAAGFFALATYGWLVERRRRPA